MKFSVTVTLKKDVLDPQGKVIHQALDGMGFKDVNEVRQGKYFEIEVEDNDHEKAENKIKQNQRNGFLKTFADGLRKKFQTS